MIPEAEKYAVKKGLEKELLREFQRKTMLTETAISNNVLEHKYQNLIKEIKTGYQQHCLDKVRLERRPEQLTRDVVGRMYQNGLTQKEWESTGAAGRLNMLRKAADIMAQEMLLPQNIRAGLTVQRAKLEDGVYGSTNRFVRVIDDNRAVMEQNPCILISEQRICGGNCADAYTTLFHEMNHVMQLVSVTESVPWTEDVAYWRSNIKYYADGRQSYIEYLTGPLEAYAHAQAALFEKVYCAQKYEPVRLKISFTGSDIGKQLASCQKELDYQIGRYKEAQKWVSYYTNNLNHPERYTRIGGKPDVSTLKGFQFELDKWQKEVSRRGHEIAILKSNISDLGR